MPIDHIWIRINIFEPTEVLHEEAAGVDVDPSVLDDYGQPHLVAEHPVDIGRAHQFAAFLLVEILMKVGVAQFPDLPARALQLAVHVFQT